MVIGVGLSRTGTTSLNEALEILGLRSVHYCPDRFLSIMNGKSTDFRVMDDVDAVTDIPAAIFYKELSKEYLGSKFILTLREEQDWLKSVRHHYETLDDKIDYLYASSVQKDWLRSIGKQVQAYVYGGEYISVYRRHIQAVSEFCDPLLSMNIVEGDGWEKLCPFLELPTPNKSFPHVNKKFKGAMFS